MRETTIDHEIGASSLPGPYMIKLDTHGYEVPILLGAKETLRKANLVVIETYNFRLREGVLLFHEMVAYMRDLGFGLSTCRNRFGASSIMRSGRSTFSSCPSTAPNSARPPTGRRGAFDGLRHRTIGMVVRPCSQFATSSYDPALPCSFVSVIVRQPRQRGAPIGASCQAT